MLIFRYFLQSFFLAIVFVAVLMAGNDAIAADESDVPHFRLSFYKHDYAVSPVKPEGTALGFDDVKKFIPLTFPEYKDVEREPIETIHFLFQITAGYRHVFHEGMGLLADRLIEEKLAPADQREKLLKDMRTAFDKGQWKAYSKHFLRDGPAVGFQFAVVQEQYVRYVTCVYVYNMIVNSPEGQKAIEEFKALEEQRKADETLAQ